MDSQGPAKPGEALPLTVAAIAKTLLVAWHVKNMAGCLPARAGVGRAHEKEHGYNSNATVGPEEERLFIT
jgi:hypothetical protein